MQKYEKVGFIFVLVVCLYFKVSKAGFIFPYAIIKIFN